MAEKCVRTFRQDAERGVFYMLILWAADIQKDFGERRVLNVEKLEIHDSDRLGLAGENGAGKSTLLKILAGDMQPDAGRIGRKGKVCLAAQFGSGRQTDEKGDSGRRMQAQQLREGLSGGELTRRRISQAIDAQPQLLLLDDRKKRK